jgi:hypothetical protein
MQHILVVEDRVILLSNLLFRDSVEPQHLLATSTLAMDDGVFVDKVYHQLFHLPFFVLINKIIVVVRVIFLLLKKVVERVLIYIRLGNLLFRRRLF